MKKILFVIIISLTTALTQSETILINNQTGIEPILAWFYAPYQDAESLKTGTRQYDIGQKNQDKLFYLREKYTGSLWICPGVKIVNGQKYTFSKESPKQLRDSGYRINDIACTQPGD